MATTFAWSIAAREAGLLHWHLVGRDAAGSAGELFGTMAGAPDGLGPASDSDAIGAWIEPRLGRDPLGRDRLAAMKAEIDAQIVASGREAVAQPTQTAAQPARADAAKAAIAAATAEADRIAAVHPAPT